MKLHKEVEKDYLAKYERYKVNTIKKESPQEEIISPPVEKSITVNTDTPIEETALFKDLKDYRLKKSREENIKPYFIYYDNQLKDLISKMPRNKEELQTVDGFGKAKANKYGDEILSIIVKY